MAEHSLASNVEVSPETLAAYRNDIVPLGRFCGVGGQALLNLLDYIDSLKHRVLELQKRTAHEPFDGLASIGIEPRGSKFAVVVCFDDFEQAKAARDNVSRAAVTKSAKCALKGCDNDAPLGGVCAAHETSARQTYGCGTCGKPIKSGCYCSDKCANADE